MRRSSARPEQVTAAFTFDLILWHWSIRENGAGMATVLGNLASVVVALLA
ncbi:MAG TPA: hypothetical protein VMV52_07800 [Candidatus Nanopelagicaceae bacterium]|nr:hypothetical protein [Candidatus Nanopelagicaceae bacterium]